MPSSNVVFKTKFPAEATQAERNQGTGELLKVPGWWMDGSVDGLID